MRPRIRPEPGMYPKIDIMLDCDLVIKTDIVSDEEPLETILLLEYPRDLDAGIWGTTVCSGKTLQDIEDWLNQNWDAVKVDWDIEEEV